jgi:hypothetical protein
MLVTILIISGILAAVSAGSILVFQQYQIKKKKIVVEKDYNGPAQVSDTLHIIIRVLLKRSIHIRKFVTQYVFHMMVRFMYFIDRVSFYFYAKSRNWFVKNAVRNRGTVPHFWEHLKVYKQEMDREKEIDD